jgi:hypothetical protein
MSSSLTKPAGTPPLLRAAGLGRPPLRQPEGGGAHTNADAVEAGELCLCEEFCIMPEPLAC